MLVAPAPAVDTSNGAIAAVSRRSPPAVPTLTLDPDRSTLRIVAWSALGGPGPDDGHDPRSAYVERFWLGILGPSTTWLLRCLAYGFDGQPDGFELDLADTARVLGLGERCGRHSPFVRALGRLCQFELALPLGNDALAVRRSVPWLHRRHVQRLPVILRQEHAAWEEAAAAESAATPVAGADDGVDAVRRRAAQLAASLAQLGEDVDSIERTLLHWRFHPALARQCASWAVDWVGAADAATGA